MSWAFNRILAVSFHGSDEHGPNSAPYIVLSYAYWHDRFLDDRGVVGRVVRLNKHSVYHRRRGAARVPRNPFDLLPRVLHPDCEPGAGGRDGYLSARGVLSVFTVLGHLRTGVTPAQAAADLNSIGAWLEKTYPKDDSHMSFSLAHPGHFGFSIDGLVRAFLPG